MSGPFAADARVDVARGYRFQWEEAQAAHVLLYPEGMIKLNESASLVLERCDGTRTSDGIIADLEAAFPGVDLRDDVLAFLADASNRGWIHGISDD